MTTATFPTPATPPVAASPWLKRYYTTRAIVSAIWVALAFSIGKAQPMLGAVLLIAYPAWDCLANYVDASRNGGLRANPSQFLNVVVSALVTIGVAATSTHNIHVAIGVIGVWASLSGILQLSTGVRRWKSASAQWPQILSGAQSALGGTHFVIQAIHPAAIVSVTTLAPYAAFGALYFAISAGFLAFRR